MHAVSLLTPRVCALSGAIALILGCGLGCGGEPTATNTTDLATGFQTWLPDKPEGDRALEDTGGGLDAGTAGTTDADVAAGPELPGQLTVDVDGLSFNASDAWKTFRVRNIGGGRMQYTLQADVPWLAVTPRSGINGGTYDDLIHVYALRSGLPAGSYRGHVRVLAGAAGSAEIEVLLAAGGGALSNPTLLTTGAGALDFGATDTQRTFTVRNGGDGSMAYSVITDVPWAAASPLWGVNSGADDLITVTISRVGLPGGSLEGHVLVQTPDGQTAQVNLLAEVSGGEVSGPALQISTNRVDFGPVSGGLNVTLRNVGTGVLPFSIVADHGWARVYPAGGTLLGQPIQVTCAPNRNELVTGTHETRLRVYSAGAEIATLTVTVEKPLTHPQMLVWMECNAVTDVHVNPTAAALQAWRSLSDVAVVTTTPGAAALYPKLHARVPGLRIIPGLKTWPCLGDGLDSVAGWQQIATNVAQIAAASGETTFILENETATWAYFEGTETIDFAQLRQGLALLPAGLDYVWYPSVRHAGVGPMRDRALALDAVTAEVLHCRFTDQSYGHPAWPNRSDWVYVRGVLEDISDNPLPLVWFGCNNGFCYWESSQIQTILNVASGSPRIVLYPGAGYAAQCAQEINNVLWPPVTLP